MRLGMFFHIIYPLEINSTILLTPKKKWWRWKWRSKWSSSNSIILVNLVLGVIIILVLQVEVMVASQMIHMEFVQIAPLPKSLEEDIDMTDVLNNTISLSRGHKL